MSGLKKAVRSFLVEDDGATMAEYGLMVALIAAVCIAAVTLLGTNIRDKFTDVSTAVGAA